MEIDDDSNLNLMYNLSMPIQHHKDTLRTVACNNNGLVVTGSFDKTCAFYQSDGTGKYNFLKDTFYHDDYIYTVRPDALDRGFFSGGKDKRIIYMDNEGNPLGEYCGDNGHSGTVCSISQNKCNPNVFISGSWDTTAIIWDVNQQIPLNVLQGHSYAVTVLALPNQNFVTGSQDKNLNFWDKNGNKISTVSNAHGDIIRAIIISPSGESIFTTSNDMQVKEWSFSGQLLNTFTAHESFIFSMCANNFTKQIFTCGDDRCVKVWRENGTFQQNLPHPNTVWDGCVNNLNGDLLTACADGFLRVFSTKKDRWMSHEALEQYNNLCEMANAQEEGSGDKQKVDVNKLPSITEMASMKNVKDGEIRLFNNFGKGEAYCYKASENQWQLLGEVMGQNNAPTKKYYPGDGVFKPGDYDYVFDVELEGRITQLPFNEGDNILMAAEKFIGREKLHKAYTDDIMRFLRTNTGKQKNKNKPTITQEKDYSKPKTAPKKRVNQGDSKPQATQHFSFPNLNHILYDSVNSEGPIKKINELNSKIEENDTINKKLEDYQLKLIGKVINTIGNKNFYHNSTFNDMELKEFLNLFTAWHGDYLIPVFDVFRMYLIHPESGLLFKQVGGGIEQLTILLQNIKNSNNMTIKILVLRCLCNLFNNEYSKSLLTVTKRDDILNILSGLQDSDNKNIRNGIASLLFNYSCTFSSSNDAEGPLQMCAIINELLGKEKNEDNIITLLKTLANLFVVNKNNRDMGNEMDEKSVINEINDNGNSSIKELKEYLLILLD